MGTAIRFGFIGRDIFFLDGFLVKDFFRGGGIPGVLGADLTSLPPKPEDALDEGMAGVLGTAMRCGFAGREDD